MRTILLSFKADVYEKLKSGQKIYEHRRVFPNESIKAYLYISSPVKAIEGILYLSNRIDLLEYKSDLKDKNSELAKRIDLKLQEHRYVMEIAAFQRTNRIGLNVLRKDLLKFIVPQMYYFIDNTPLLDYLEENLCYDGGKIIHTFENKTDIDAVLS